MRSLLRTLLIEPWQRLRLSLLSFLLGSTLVAVMVAHRFASREVSQLRQQVAALRAENKGFRDQLGILTIGDVAFPHAIYSSDFRALNTWEWRFYAPKDHRFRLCLAYDGIALDGLPASDARIVVLADDLPVEGVVTCSFSRGGKNDPQSSRVNVHLNHITTKVDLPHESSAWLRTNLFEKQIGGEKGTINAAGGQPLVLLRLRGYRATEVEEHGVKAYPMRPSDDSPGPGVLLWIEEQPSSLAAAS